MRQQDGLGGGLASTTTIAVASNERAIEKLAEAECDAWFVKSLVASALNHTSNDVEHAINLLRNGIGELMAEGAL